MARKTEKKVKTTFCTENRSNFIVLKASDLFSFAIALIAATRTKDNFDFPPSPALARSFCCCLYREKLFGFFGVALALLLRKTLHKAKRSSHGSKFSKRFARPDRNRNRGSIVSATRSLSASLIEYHERVVSYFRLGIGVMLLKRNFPIKINKFARVSAPHRTPTWIVTMIISVSLRCSFHIVRFVLWFFSFLRKEHEFTWGLLHHWCFFCFAFGPIRGSPSFFLFPPEVHETIKKSHFNNIIFRSRPI